MKQENTFENTDVSLTPSFLGNGWEVSLSPKLHELQEMNQFDFVITFSSIKDWLLKMLLGRRREVAQWTTAIARLLL